MDTIRTAAVTAVLLLVAGVVTACVDPDTEPPPAALNPPAEGQTPPSSLDPLPAPEDSDPLSPSAPDAPSPGAPSPDVPSPDVPRCDAEVEAGSLATISTQLDAFSRGDFPAALAAASAAFRAGTDVARFQAMIEQNYGLLTEDATATLEACLPVRSDAAEVVVEVTTAAGVRAAFAYRVRLDAGRWVIDGAVRLSRPPAVT